MTDRFDEELRSALKREDPPDGFMERVLARVAEERARPSRLDRWRAWFAAPAIRRALVAAACLVVIAGIQYQREMERRARAEQAKEQVLLALHITAEQLQLAQESARRVLGD